ncbi:MAG TPA: PAS domain S-box protein [Stellaceae bacterium]|nr:PAS domain S-box protein [Stellaceae bacterium]
MATGSEAAQNVTIDHRLQLLLDALSDSAIYWLDPDGVVASWNAGAARITGYQASEILGEHFSRFFTLEDRQHNVPQQMLAAAAREGKVEYEGWRIRRDGSRFWAQSVLHAISSETGSGLAGYAQLTRDQTERQQAQEALRESERRFRALVDGVSDYAIFMLDPSGVVTNWNAGAERIKGYAANEIIGHHFSEFYTREDRLAGIPVRALETALREGRFEADGWRLRKNGSRFFANVVVTPIRDENGSLMGFAKITRDVTEREEAQRALRETEQQLRLLLGGIVDHAIYMLDPNGVITSWNAGAEKIKGYSAEEILGQHFSKFYTSADRMIGLPARALHTALTTGRYEAEGWRVRKDGSEFWASVALDAIRDDSGRLVGYAKVTRDISQQREMQLALEKTREQLAHAQKIEALGRLTGGIAHDFNNILMVVGGQSEILAQRLSNPQDRRAIEAIADATKRGEALTRQMLTFSRRQRLEPSIVHFGQQIERTRSLLISSLNPNVSVMHAVAPNLWPIAVDPPGFDLALLNLVINARDAMPEGGVVTIAAENVRLAKGEVTPDLEGEFVAISVTDTGVGIPDDVLPNVFDPFFTTKAPDKGTGLGLSQVHGFAHASGGAVAIASTLGKGTSVTLYFPRVEDEGRREEEPKRGAMHKGAGLILVVDDNPEVANVSASLLEQLGYRVKIAHSAAAALDELKSGESFDLVFSDIVMPGAMNGIELARAGKQLYPELPFLLATGYSEAALSAGDEFTILHKPFTQAELSLAVMTAFVNKGGGNLVRFPRRESQARG